MSEKPKFDCRGKVIAEPESLEIEIENANFISAPYTLVPPNSG